MAVNLAEISPPANLYWPPEDLPRLLGRIPRLAATILPLGKSREGRPLFSLRVGRGPIKISVIAGAHADEPVGPATLLGLCRWLLKAPEASSLLEKGTFFLCPHVNPDGAHRNAAWVSAYPCPVERYLQGAVRELPGDDMEFNFSLEAKDPPTRPENRAVAQFLRSHGPFSFHASLHGMAAAEGTWFLINQEKVAATAELRGDLKRFVAALGLPLHDWDRHGEKGFHRIERGFATTPTAAAMKAHFVAVRESVTAAKFHPTSMELAMSLGGDPLCMVSELPLYLVKPSPANATPPGKNFLELRERLTAARMELSSGNAAPLEKLKKEFGLQPLQVNLASQAILAMVFLGSGLVTLDEILPKGKES